MSFWLELDGGTEIRPRLVEKLDRYAALAGMEGAADAVLFCFPTARREASAREFLADCGITVATGLLPQHLTMPLGSNWLPIGSEFRLDLFGLGNDGRHALARIGGLT